MILTKYEHACFTVEKEGKLLVVDPGAFTTDLPALDSVIAIVVTHEHADHFDTTALSAIVARNPDAVVYAHTDITRQLGDILAHRSIAPGDRTTTGPFTLEFFGGDHAVIHDDIPPVANVAVLIDDAVYYPGDSFTQPDRPVDILALPTAAPWLKISETIDFLQALAPRLAFPTHDAVASPAGKRLADTMLPAFAQNVRSTYQRLHEPLDTDA